MSGPAIEIKDVQMSFGLSFALGPLSIAVPRGTIYALVGPNGAGKTTLLNMLMGVGQPALGSIQILGHDISRDEVSIKRRTAYAGPDMDYRGWGTVGRAIDFVRGFYPDWDAARCQELASDFGLHMSTSIAVLSLGERMKLALILALSRDAELLVLDEPTVGLDAIARRQLFSELLKFMKRDHRTVLISSHQLTDLERFADHVAIMNHGRLLAVDRMDALIERFRQLDVQTGRKLATAIPGIYIIEQEGNRARLLIDRNAMPASALNAIDFHVLAEARLTLEDLFLALIKITGGGCNPHQGAA